MRSTLFALFFQEGFFFRTLVPFVILALLAGCSEDVTAPAPEISSISPSYGYTGSAVLIKGKNFAPDPASNTVRFADGSGISANVTVASSTSLRVIVPEGEGDGKLVVTTRGGSGMSKEIFRVLKPPVITGTNPEQALPGAVIVVEGENLYNYQGAIIRINDVKAKVLGQNGDGLVVLLPTSASTGKITYELSGVKTESPGDFLVPEFPIFTTYGPVKGPPGTVITIAGENFSNDVEDYLAWVGDTPASVSSASSTTLKIVVPEGASTGPMKIVLYGLIFISEAGFEVITQ